MMKRMQSTEQTGYSLGSLNRQFVESIVWGDLLWVK